jgi:hypothetical protein
MVATRAVQVKTSEVSREVHCIPKRFDMQFCWANIPQIVMMVQECGDIDTKITERHTCHLTLLVCTFGMGLSFSLSNLSMYLNNLHL